MQLHNHYCTKFHITIFFSQYIFDFKKMSTINQQKNPQPQQTIKINQQIQVEEQPMLPFISNSSNPWLSAFFILIKLVTLIIFIIFPLFMSKLAVSQIVIIIASIDFWVIKNVAGRILVGLRWWIDFDQNGEQHWKFECKVNEDEINKNNSTVFWWTLGLTTILWVILLIVNIISLDVTKSVVAIYCIALLGFSFYAFYKCSKIQVDNVLKLKKQEGQEYVKNLIGAAITANIF